MGKRPSKAQIAADEARIRRLQQAAMEAENERIRDLRREALDLAAKKTKAKKKGWRFW